MEIRQETKSVNLGHNSGMMVTDTLLQRLLPTPYVLQLASETLETMEQGLQGIRRR
jgi:hypothetical protein